MMGTETKKFKIFSIISKAKSLQLLNPGRQLDFKNFTELHSRRFSCMFHRVSP